MSPMLLRLLVTGVLLLPGCTVIAPEGDGLYKGLGGEAGITEIVDAFLGELSEDQDVLPLFANTDIERFREKLIELLCDTAGGPCTYSGDSMRDTHRGMQISRAQFNSVVEDLIRAMEHEQVPVGAQNELLRRLAAMYGDIVYL